MESNQHRAWAEINMKALEHNYQSICAQANAPVLCVVKANAYGHGAIQAARRLAELGAPYFAVATVLEALELRQNGIDTPILLLGYIDESDMGNVVRNHITAPVYDVETAQMLSSVAVAVGETLSVHFKADTGMTRLGFPAWDCEGAARDILSCAALPGLRPEGIFTHFAVSDTTDGGAYTRLQYDRFHTLCETLRNKGLDLPLRHCANSGAIQQYGDMHETMVRAGIILYGYRPDPALPVVMDLQPVMTVKARVAQVRDIPADTAISYGGTFRTDKPTRMAVITMGYADGFLRTGSGRAHVLVHGRKLPVVGRICMDMCMVALPEDMSIQRGDEVTIFGPSGWTADDAASAAGTISYEVLCAVSRRVPRFYIG